MEEIRACGVLEPKVSAFHGTSSSSSVKLSALHGRLLLLWTSHSLTCTSNYLSSVAIIPLWLFNSYFQSFLVLETFKWFFSFAGFFSHESVVITFRGFKPRFHAFSQEETLFTVTRYVLTQYIVCKRTLFSQILFLTSTKENFICFCWFLLFLSQSKPLCNFNLVLQIYRRITWEIQPFVADQNRVII